MSQLVADRGFYNSNRTKKRPYINNNRQTGSLRNLGMLNAYHNDILIDSTDFAYRIYGFDNKLIEISEKFKKELNDSNDIDKSLAIKAFSDSINLILGLEPDNLSIEITESESIYYTLLKNNFSFYIEEFVDDNEVIVASFYNGIKQDSFSGNIQEIMFKINSMLEFDF